MNPTNGICAMVFLISVFAANKVSSISSSDLNTKCGANPPDAQVVEKLGIPSTDTGKCLMLCFLKELDMLDSNQKYDEEKSFPALRDYLSLFSDKIIKAVNSAAAKFAKGIDSKSGTCEYGYEIMKFIIDKFTLNRSFFIL